MEENMTYETFVRGAFSIRSERLTERLGDMANLADTDVFDLSWNDVDYLNKAKSAVAYSIAIYNSEIFETSEVSNVDRTAMENLLGNALNSTNSQDLITVIDAYKVYRDRYFTFIWNR
ncbi:hypothetical protein [Paraclostridium sordellii]|uniref:hypothetical protein n=1 Tax=Paraclostridium sordellii TaxID=1505 RepID=UPI0005DF5E8E|nr:hypothetical protein [Paeniclostridium sordellii]CEP39728.1 Uncharacterised protein [[Clostridium] sordellii] [Paeniclostridium sordellii]